MGIIRFPGADYFDYHSSDADSDVLADYVLALIRADTPEPELRANAIENLEDFLKDRLSPSPACESGAVAVDICY